MEADLAQAEQRLRPVSQHASAWALGQMANPEHESSSPSLLLRLPPELRLVIYEHLFASLMGSDLERRQVQQPVRPTFLSPEKLLIIDDFLVYEPISKQVETLPDFRTCYPTPPLMRVSGLLRRESMPVWSARLRERHIRLASHIEKLSIKYNRVTDEIQIDIDRGLELPWWVQRWSEAAKDQWSLLTGKEEEMHVLLLCVEELERLKEQRRV